MSEPTLVPFNVNDYVRVKLNDRGRSILREQHENLRRQFPSAGEYAPPEEDAEGWSRWQLWSLMQDLGEHITMGSQPPFETTIEVELRAMQGKEQAAAAPPPPDDSRRKGTTPLIVGKTYDPATASRIPPPPEDALLDDLTTLDGNMEGAQEAIQDTPTVVSMIGQWRRVVQRARDRIAADAKRDAKQCELLQAALRDNREQYDRAIAAEARAQGLEALLRESQNSIGGDWRERRDAALAPDSGKERGT